MSIESPQIIQKITIPASVDQVWDFLLNEEMMKQWFHANTFTIDAIEGGKIEIPFSFGGAAILVEGEIGLIIPKKKFAFTWIERNQYGEAWFNNTMVTIELAPAISGTKLTLTHDGFKYLPEGIRTAVYQKYLAFWDKPNILTRLQSLIKD